MGKFCGENSFTRHQADGPRRRAAGDLFAGLIFGDCHQPEGAVYAYGDFPALNNGGVAFSCCLHIHGFCTRLGNQNPGRRCRGGRTEYASLVVPEHPEDVVPIEVEDHAFVVLEEHFNGGRVDLLDPQSCSNGLDNLMPSAKRRRPTFQSCQCYPCGNHPGCFFPCHREMEFFIHISIQFVVIYCAVKLRINCFGWFCYL